MTIITDFIGGYPGYTSGNVYYNKQPLIFNENKSILLDGNSGTIVIPDIGTSITESFTLEVWFYIPENIYIPLDTLTIFEFSDNSFKVYINESGILRINYGASTYSPSTQLDTSAITHFVLTMNNSNGYLIPYVNNVALGTLVTATRVSAGASLLLGPFVGLLDEVSIYNTVLSATKIKIHYACGISNFT